MKDVDYQDFSLRIHTKAESGDTRIPVSATVELTYRCNNNCVHCYCSLPADDENATAAELTREEIGTLFGELKEMGCLWLLITGGEPLLRPDFKEIYLSAKRHGFIISLFTNGTHITEDIAALLEEYPPFMVEVTMYGATPKTYERITRLPGSYELYWSGIQRLLDRKIKLKLKSMALTTNRHELHRMHGMARDLGCEFRFDPVVHGRIDTKNTSTPKRYRLTTEDVIRLDREFPERMEAHREFCDRMAGQVIEEDRLIMCSAGRSSLHVTPDGTVLPCAMLINEGRSLRKERLKDIWNTHFKEVLSRKKDFLLECDGCALRNVCDQCVGWSFVEHGVMDRKVDYICDIIHERALSLAETE